MTTAATAARPAPRRPSGTTFRSRLARLRVLHSRKTTIGIVIVGVFILLAIVGPMLAPYDPNTVSGDTLQPPSSAHWLGTTQSGQDLLSQMLYGARISVVVGFAAAILATGAAVVVGLTAGYLGGLADDLLSLLANVFLVMPSLPLSIILVSMIPNSGSAGIIVIIAVTGWAWGSRVLRAQTMSLRRRDFVEAARATGERTRGIIARDILPNQLAVIASAFLGTVTGAILTQASLAFLGLTSVSEWSWGTILYWAQVSSAVLVGAWWWFVPAGLAIAILGTGLALLNFGVDEFINPRLREAGIGTRAEAKRRKAEAKARKRGAIGLPTRAKVPAGPDAPDIVLDIRNLTFQYGTGASATTAINNVSLQVQRGQVLGIAGESGSGKSTLANAITRLYRAPARATNGQIRYTSPSGKTANILEMGDEELRRFRWDELAIVFQSAMNALNPVLTIGAQIDDVLRAHRADMSGAERMARTRELFELVGIQADRVKAYPHELSGGMRQRAMIAIGLALDPEVIIMDEPTTALDVVIQRQIIARLIELKDQLGFTIIFITHDLSLLIELSDVIAVMYAGAVVECAPATEFYADPRHPYSRGLLSSFPTLSGEKRELTGIPGSPPDLRRLPSGCPFHPRCSAAMEICRTSRPSLVAVGAGAASDTNTEPDSSRRELACHLADSGSKAGA